MSTSHQHRGHVPAVGLVQHPARDATRRALIDLHVEMQTMSDLIDTRQPLQRGIPSAEAMVAAQLERAGDVAAQAERQRNGEPLGHGRGSAPLNVSVASLGEEITRAFREHRAELRRHFAPVLSVLTARELSAIDLVSGVTDLISHLGRSPRSIDLLARISADAERFHYRCARLIDGPERAWAGEGALCPLCGLPSLFLLRVDGAWVISCLKPPKALRYAPCACSDPLCECKHRPGAYRHTWHDRGGSSRADSWTTLQNRMTTRRDARTVTNRSRP